MSRRRGSRRVRRLGQAGIHPNSLRAVFLTHLHSDHIADLFGLVWLSNPGGTLHDYTEPVPVYGPGSAGGVHVPPGSHPVPVVGGDEPTPGTAAMIAGDGSVTFSGDTTRSDNVARIGSGTDVLVHEVIDIDYYAREYGDPSLVEHMEQTHTTAPDVGRVATAADARSVVLTHIGPGDPREISDDQWESAVRTTYRGPVRAGRDLTQSGVGRR